MGLWLLLAPALCLIPVTTQGQDIPAAINYQGKLTDSAGKALTNGLYQVDFRIWDTPTATNSAGYYWGRSFPIYVASNGMFNVALTDDGGTLSWPGSTGKVATVLSAFEGQPRYLGLRVTQLPGGPVTGPVEISPRQLLASAPYAIHAQQASSAANATVATNAVKFNNFSTNDFLMTNRTSQTLTGNLTITNGNLTVSSNLTVGRSATITSDLAVKGGATLSSNLTVLGKLGIGVANPAIPLTFPDVAGDKISFYGNTNGPHTGIGISSTALQLHTPDSTTDIELGYGANANFTKTMIVKGTGNVGIGTNSPNGKLDVNGSIKVSGISPIEFQTYQLSNLSDQGEDYGVAYPTTYPTNKWSAALVGWSCVADIKESDHGTYRFRAVKSSAYVLGPGATNWVVEAFFHHQSGVVSNVFVDVMFIRKELVNDLR